MRTSNWPSSTGSTAGRDASRRAVLTQIRKLLRDWRQSGLVFESRSILVVEQQGVGQRARALSSIARAR